MGGGKTVHQQTIMVIQQIPNHFREYKKENWEKKTTELDVLAGSRWKGSQILHQNTTGMCESLWSVSETKLIMNNPFHRLKKQYKS